MKSDSLKYLFFSNRWSIICVLILGNTIGSRAQIKPEETEDWSFKPPIVIPSKKDAPSDAIVLFGARSDVDKWEGIDGTQVKWKSGKTLKIVKDANDIQTKRKFGSIQLHLEWKTPDPRKDKGTSRGNSGVFFMGLYELQIYESYQYATPLYYNGMAGSIYKQYAPLVNACLPPKTWQTYDVIFETPVFNEDQILKTPAYITVFLNGILILNHVALKGPTVYQGFPQYEYHDSKLPLRLQEHDSNVEFRNIWVRELN